VPLIITLFDPFFDNLHEAWQASGRSAWRAAIWLAQDFPETVATIGMIVMVVFACSRG
jgi:hypothetical protein